MKKKISRKITCALLIFVFLFNFCGCKKEDSEVVYDKNQRLTIEEMPLNYTEETINNLTSLYTETGVSLIKSFSGLTPQQAQKESLSTNFTTNILPIFYRLKIYPEQATKLLSSAGEFIKSTEQYSFMSIYSLYRECLIILGSEKSGQLLYELSLNSIANKKDAAIKKYEEYGYSFYKTDVMRYEGLCTDLKKLGEEKFITALSISSLIFSTSLSVSQTVKENAFLVSDGELLYILDRQGDILSQKCPAEDEWQTFGALLSELIPRKSDTLISATVYALKNHSHPIEIEGVEDEKAVLKTIEENPELYPLIYKSTYLATAMKSMPKIFSIYTALAKNLRKEAKFSLESSPEEKEKAILSALVLCEEEIRELDLALAQYVSADFEALRNNVTAYSDREKLSKFLSETSPATLDDLILSIRESADEDSSSEGKDMESFLISYLFSISPHLTFVICQQHHICK